jgi:hypothetical protein
MGPRAHLNLSAERRIPISVGNRITVFRTRSQSLYRMSDRHHDTLRIYSVKQIRLVNDDLSTIALGTAEIGCSGNKTHMQYLLSTTLVSCMVNVQSGGTYVM